MSSHKFSHIKKADKDWDKKEQEIKDLLQKYNEHFDNPQFNWDEFSKDCQKTNKSYHPISLEEQKIRDLEFLQNALNESENKTNKSEQKLNKLEVI